MTIDVSLHVTFNLFNSFIYLTSPCAMFAVIFIPDLHLQAALRPEPELHSRPVALIDGASPKPVILQLTQAARDAGVREGMTLTQALARCPNILIKARSAAQENAAADV